MAYLEDTGEHMNIELIYILMMSLSGGLYALGGTGGWKLASKLWRRAGIPAFLALSLHFLGVEHTIIALSCITLSVGLCMGYGDSKRWSYRAIVFSTYAISTLFIGFSAWVLISPIASIILFYLSRKLFQNHFVWKICEFLFGAMIGVSYVSAYNNRWGA